MNQGTDCYAGALLCRNDHLERGYDGRIYPVLTKHDAERRRIFAEFRQREVDLREIQGDPPIDDGFYLENDRFPCNWFEYDQYIKNYDERLLTHRSFPNHEDPNEIYLNFAKVKQAMLDKMKNRIVEAFNKAMDERRESKSKIGHPTNH